MLADQYLWGSDKTRDKASEYVKWQGVRGFKGWGFCSPSESLDKAYESGDPRREATIIYDGENMEGVGVINFKDEPGVQPRANKRQCGLQLIGMPIILLNKIATCIFCVMRMYC